MPWSCCGVDAGGKSAAKPSSGGEDGDLLLEVEQLAQGDVEEVAAAAGGVEHADGAELGGEARAGLAELVRVAGAALRPVGLVALRRKVVGLGLHLGPAAAQRRHQHRLDDEQDVVAAGVVGAELGALGGVQAALEEGAEDGGLDAGPVEGGGVGEESRPSAVEVEHGGVVEQAAVEVGMWSAPKQPPAVMAAKSWRRRSRKAAGGSARPRRAGGVNRSVGQEADVFGEEAEEEADEEVGGVLGSWPPQARRLSARRGELGGGASVTCVGGLLGAQGLGVVKKARRTSRAGALGRG